MNCMINNRFFFNTIFTNCRQALKNFEKCVKPGGLLLIDHRNYDHIIDTGFTPAKCIYYNVCILLFFFRIYSNGNLILQSSHMADIKTSVLYVSGKPNMVMMDYMIDSANDKDGTINEESVR